MKKKHTVAEIMLFNNIIYKLYEQQIHYPINVAYKLLKLKKTFDDIESVMISRWKILLGETFDLKNLSDEQYNVYVATVSAEVEIDTFDLTINDIVDNEKVELTLSDMERLTYFLE